jgi:hypothetical protein
MVWQTFCSNMRNWPWGEFERVCMLGTHTIAYGHIIQAWYRYYVP